MSIDKKGRKFEILKTKMNYYLNTVLLMLIQPASQMKHKLESRLPGEISITSDIQMTPPLWQKVKN